MKHEQIPNQDTVYSDRMVLRPLRASDEGLLTLYAGDERVAKSTSSIPHPLPPGTEEAFIKRALSEDRQEDVWAMDGSASGLGELLGVIGLKRLSEERSEIGYWVAPAFWNTGFATGAIRSLLDVNPQNIKTVFASVFQSNTASAHVLTNLGFDYIGDAETFSVAQERTVQTWTYLKTLS